MYQQVSAGNENLLSPDHFSTINTTHKLGALFWHQSMPPNAEKMCQRVLLSYEKMLEPDHQKTREVTERLQSLGKSST